MSVEAPAAAPVVKTPKKKASKPKAPAAHPKYSEMVKQAITTLKERGGSSRQAILKYILKNFSVGADEKSVNARLKLALRAGVKNSSLKQSKGTGASGSFRLGAVTEKKPKKKVAKKPAAKKVKKPAATAAKKTKAAAKPKTPKKKASPKKAKAAAKPKTPKKAAAKKPAAKKPAAKKPAAKKPAAKKPAAKKPAAKKATK